MLLPISDFEEVEYIYLLILGVPNNTLPHTGEAENSSSSIHRLNVSTVSVAVVLENTGVLLIFS